VLTGFFVVVCCCCCFLIGSFSWKRYTGTWDNDKKHGSGFVKYANGASYAGQFVHGRKEGAGKLHFSNGDVYSGGSVQSALLLFCFFLDG